jgi:hypothetical protein
MKKSLSDMHAHAISVHFTNALFPVAVFFLIIFLFSGREPFRQTYGHLMILATLSVPPAYLTGLITWKEKYNGALAPIFLRKIRYSPLIFVLGCLCTIWYWMSPGIAEETSGAGLVFLLLNLALLIPVTYLGHLGGKIVFEFKR